MLQGWDCGIIISCSERVNSRKNMVTILCVQERNVRRRWSFETSKLKDNGNDK